MSDGYAKRRAYEALAEYENLTVDPDKVQEQMAVAQAYATMALVEEIRSISTPPPVTLPTPTGGGREVIESLRKEGPTIDVPTAAKALGISKGHAYELIRTDEFSPKTLKLGGSYRVVTESVIRLLGAE